MKGALVVGLVNGAGEGAVAAAVGAVLRRSGEQVRVERLLALGDRDADARHAYEVLASPVVAARHAGETLDPAELVRELRDGDGTLVAALPGGILAALTPRFTVRDLAAELRLPVILAVRADADATNLVRLSVAAARAARLTIAAIVLTGWPDPPDRAQLDERRLLSETVGLSVLELPASPGARADAVRDWPVASWVEPPREPEPAPPPPPRAQPAVPVAAPVGDLGLEPYAAWTERPTGDPRSTPRPRIMEVMLEIIGAEGPMIAGRAYALYSRASGGKKLTTTARAPLSSSVHWLAQQRDITMTDDVVRLPDQPAVRVRELGPRTLEEVPLDEIAELMRRLNTRDEGALKRGVLQAYGLVRLTQRADEYLGLAIARL
jgi:AAA domain